MGCKVCLEDKFKEKLGRCRSCITLNVVLLLGSALLWYVFFLDDVTQVASIALLFTVFASALLMLAHVAAFIYYQVTQDKHNPK
ncbi:hypothetical protein PCNPT3_12470 [Psychromonas sp. CNPT3]|uniref:DUF3624 domain-containing protein n=1 Tax=Psychromonas sp. CNPT3 TaxID=314282 RepID=UPI00006E508F|nr:DUF3624 domain-containing protein [Psychromonas sp. CNPT3]AGH82430.1 hypothetical protein PCNPT3_12470 [Psychromonas sp. CNPT3]